MFAPVGYVPMYSVAGQIFSYSVSFYEKIALQTAREGAEEDFHLGLRNALGGAAVYVQWLLDICLYQQPVPIYLASPQGTLLRASHVVFFSKEQYSTHEFSWPLDKQTNRLWHLAESLLIQDAMQFTLENYYFLGEDFSIRIRDIPDDAMPDQKEFIDPARETLRPLTGWAVCIREADQDALFKALVEAYDWENLTGDRESSATTKLGKAGRPEKQTLARSTYFNLYPKGHEAKGKTWKIVEREISAVMGKPTSEATIRRAISSVK